MKKTYIHFQVQDLHFYTSSQPKTCGKLHSDIKLFLFNINFIMTKGESNMKFVCQMLQKKDPYSPSIAQLRRFTLPDFKPPTKVYNLKQTYESCVPWFLVS